MNLLWPIGKRAVHWRIYRLIAQDDRTMGLDEPLFCSFYKLTAIEDDVRKLGTTTTVQNIFCKCWRAPVHSMENMYHENLQKGIYKIIKDAILHGIPKKLQNVQ